MKILLAVNQPFIEREATRLTSDATAGSSVVLLVENSDGIVANDYVCVGTGGSDTAELCQVSAVTDTSITVGTLKLGHTSGEAVTKYRYNKRKFYGSTTQTGSYTELTSDGSPADIDVSDPQGTYFEYTGGEGYLYFKATYYNSTDSTETSADEDTGTLADESTRYASVYAIRKRAGLSGNARYADSRIEQKRSQAENEINSSLAARYVLPLAEVPALISNLCETLAAGYIAYEEYPDEGDGAKWLGEARAILKSIAKGTQKLIGADYIEMTRNVEVGVIGGYPNTEYTDCAVFSMDDHY